MWSFDPFTKLKLRQIKSTAPTHRYAHERKRRTQMGRGRWAEQFVFETHSHTPALKLVHSTSWYVCGVCMCVRYLCVYNVYMRVYACLQHTYTRMHARTHAHKHTRECTHAHACTHAHPMGVPSVHVCATHIRARTHTHTYTHAHSMETHTRTHTHTHIHTRTLNGNSNCICVCNIRAHTHTHTHTHAHPMGVPKHACLIDTYFHAPVRTAPL